MAMVGHRRAFLLFLTALVLPGAAGAQQPVIGLSPISLTFTAPQGGANPPNQTVAISNTGSGTLTWTATKNAVWLNVLPGSGTGAATLTVSVNISGLIAGTYQGSIEISAAGATNTPQNVAVTLTVTAPPSIVLNPVSLAFSAPQGGTNPAAQTVNVTNQGGGALAWTASVTSTVWLSVPPSGTGPMVVSVNTGGLIAGAYSGSIQVSSAGAVSKILPVTLTITPPVPPAIGLSRSVMNFTAVQGGANPAPQTVTVSNAGGGTLTWTATASSASGNWLSVTPGSGTGAGILTVSINVAGLPAGAYSGVLEVAAAGASNTPRAVAINLTVQSPPTISLSTNALSFTARVGSDPAPQAFTISNGGGGTLNWTAAITAITGGNWLALSPASGSGKATITVAVSSASLPVDSYAATITVSDPAAGNSPQTVAVTLDVTAVPALALSASSLQFAGTTGSNPSGQQLVLTTSDSSALNWTATVAVSGGAPNWLSVTPNSGTTPSGLSAYVSTLGLTEGTYQASITIAAQGAANSPLTVAVTLTLTTLPALVLSNSSPAFSGTPGSAPASQPLVISHTGPDALSWTATAAVSGGGPNWLSVTPAAGTTPATVTVAVDTAGLGPGTYQGSITVTAAGAGNSPQAVNVTLSLTAVPLAVLAVRPASLQFAANVGANRPPQSFQVLNTGAGALGWTATVATESGGAWLSMNPTTGVAPSTVTVTVSSASLAAGIYSGSITIAALEGANAANSPQVVTVTLVLGAPRIGQNGIVNGASFSPEATLSPGAIASLFGTSLAAGTEAASQLPLPATLAGTQVLVNNTPAPLFFVSPMQINFQMPAEIAGSSAQVQVISSGLPGPPATVKMAPEMPGLFTAPPGGTGQGAVLNQNSSINGKQNPAAAGSIIQIFATGLGATEPPLATGQPGTTQEPLNATVQTPTVLIGGTFAQVLFSGAAPGFVGLYQVNVRVPAVAPGNAVPLALSIGGFFSNTVTIGVK